MCADRMNDGCLVEKVMWWREFESLDFFGGKVFFIGDDLEDMIEITYPDGMFIDVGKAEKDGIYYITVLSSNDRKGWNSPLSEIAVINKEQLFDSIQKVIIEFRNGKI